MNRDNARKVPADAPTEFIKPRWQKLVMTDTGIDRRYYELCELWEGGSIHPAVTGATEGARAPAGSHAPVRPLERAQKASLRSS